MTEQASGNNNNDKKTIINAAWFRGWAYAKIEDLWTEMEQFRKEQYLFTQAQEKVEEAINGIQQYIAGRKAIQNIRSAAWGFFGGVFMLALGFALYKMFG